MRPQPTAVLLGRSALYRRPRGSGGWPCRVTATRGRPAACRVPWWSVSGGEVGDENVGVLQDEGGAEHVQLALSDRDGGGAFQAVGAGEHDGVGAVRLDQGDFVGEVQRHDDLVGVADEGEVVGEDENRRLRLDCAGAAVAAYRHAEQAPLVPK